MNVSICIVGISTFSYEILLKSDSLFTCIYLFCQNYAKLKIVIYKQLKMKYILLICN